MLMIESIASIPGEQATPSILVQEPEEEEDKTRKWKGKGKAGVVIEEDGIGLVDLYSSEITVDWTKFEPPEALRDTADTESELIAQIVHESINKVKARIAEEEEKRKAEDEAERLRQEEKEENIKREDEKETTLETSDVPLGEKSNEDGKPFEFHTEITATTENGGLQGFLAPEPPVKSKKRSFINFFRRSNNTKERGESSATGAARHRRDEKHHVSDILKTVSHASSPNPSVNEIEVECVSCLDDFSPKEMVKAPCHSYCKPCFLRLINTACENELQWPPKCCLNPIPQMTIVSNIDNKLEKVYYDRSEEWGLPISDRVYCSHQTCSRWIEPRNINRARRVAICSESHETCIICRGPQHEGDNCPEDRDMMRTDELAEQEGWRRCYKCNAYVEHSEACRHMTCLCGAQFCYVCGAPWCTCDCTMHQLANIKRQAITRRQARQERELKEEAEIQEALRQVAEYEREEALKAELLRQEQGRLAEERRQKELMERIKLEEDRRRAVEIRFRELREIFTHIHELQRTMVQSDHRTRAATLESDSATALTDLHGKLAVDSERLNSVTKEKYAKRDNNLRCEFVARLAAEQRIEEQYYADLKEYWHDRQDGEVQAAISMKEFQRKMDDGYLHWEKWRDRELDGYLWGLREEQAIKEELMQESERRLTESMREKQVDFSVRKTAELRWVQEVIEERGRMLADMETDVIENGEDTDAWFAEEPLDQHSINSVELEREFRVPGAFSWVE